MPNAPVHSYQTRVYYSANGSSYTQITGITSAQAPELAATAAPSDSLDDLGKITVAGKVDLGEFTLDMIFDRAVYATLYNTLFRATYYWKIQYPDISPITSGSTVVFQGYLRTISPPQADDDAVLRHSANVKVNTFPVFTSGA